MKPDAITTQRAARQRSLQETIVALAALVREVYEKGRTASFDQRAPELLEEARQQLEQRA